MYGGSFLGRKKLGRFLAPFDTEKGVFQIQPITNTAVKKCQKLKNKENPLENGDRNFYEEFICKIQRADVCKIE